MIDRETKLKVVQLWRYVFCTVLHPLQDKSDSS